MDEGTLILLILVGAVLVIAVVTVLAAKLGVAGPLLLVAIGLAIALIPAVHIPPIPPDWILVGVLPPLLYSAAVNLPAIEFRRDFRSISGLAVALVVVTALALGGFFWLVGIPLPVGIALGAILSPTDAVATSIAKRLGISPRVVTMLEGESLLNDATALVLLRTAIVAIAGSFSFWGAVGSFVWAVVSALVVGAVVGWIALRVRAWVGGSAANTAISFAVPFLAYLPTEELGGSGLVAAVVAGIVAGQGGRRLLTPEQRLSDRMNWHTVELVLEGAVFLVMGLELREIVAANVAESGGLWHGIWLALVALAIVLAVRAGYVTFVVWSAGRRAGRLDRERLEAVGGRLDAIADGRAPMPTRAGRRTGRGSGPGDGRPVDAARAARRVSSLRRRVTQMIGDIDYYRRSPLNSRLGAVIVWAGMRGVVTLAAAQTLPREGIEHRALLVFIAFLVAVISLMLQGLTLPTLVRVLKVAEPASDPAAARQRAELDRQLHEASLAALHSGRLVRRDGSAFPPELVETVTRRLTAEREAPAEVDSHELLELRLAAIGAMRRRLDDLSHGGAYSTEVLRLALAQLDADELSLQLRMDD
ncbi:cation:proton antiporter [Microbacterium sp.]|uniref:cation:proton antiporter n=1 Tax=Microbacterium sp. TaxID=51671 RepID=UPI003A94B5D0